MLSTTALGIWFALLALAAPAAAPAEVGQSASDPQLDLSIWKGEVVLLDFWASWCVPCGESFPWMADMEAKYGDKGLVIITVNLDTDRKAADRFLEEHPLDAQKVFDPDGRLAETYSLKVMPSAILFNRQGAAIYRHEGFRPDQAAEYERHIVQLLNPGKETPLPDAPVVLDESQLERQVRGVKPWQRGVLAQDAMRLDADPLEIETDDHIYFSKEASSGGRGFGGGGCGCN